MKKFLSILAISGALLAACSEDQTEEKSADDILENATVLTDEEVAVLEDQTEETNDEAAKENEAANADTKEDVSSEKENTQQQITVSEGVDLLLEKAKEDNVLQDFSVQENEDSIVANFSFAEDITEEQQQTVLLKYQILTKSQYPDKKIETNVDSN